MPPVRSPRRAGPFSFSTWSASTGLAVAIGVCSLLNALVHGLDLSPLRVWGGAAWYQVLSYGLVAGSPMGVLFSCFMAWSLGSSLEQSWGPRRLWLFSLGITTLAGVILVLLAQPFGVLRSVVFEGAPALVTGIWVAEGLRLGRRQISFWGVPLTGNQFALIAVAFLVLNAAFGAYLQVLPEAIGVALTYVYMHGARPQLLWLRIQDWRLRRSLKGRSRHLKLVDEEGRRNMPRDSDRYLH